MTIRERLEIDSVTNTRIYFICMFLMCEVTHTELFIDLIRNIEREVVLIGI